MLSPKGQNTNQQANKEKITIALSSVLAAVFLTAMKLVVGLMTNSLGILSEAAHSGLDLVAATVTFLGVRISGRPADREHTYGHGKVENLSALFETILLLATCLWIIYEAIQRLFFKTAMVNASLLAFLIMGVSIVIDLSRSRALTRVARKYNSQALEADALHFTTDIWSSLVVIFGLVLVRLSDYLGLEWLVKTDALAALGVAGMVVSVSIRLGHKTVAGLLDAIPSGLHDEVTRAVKDVRSVLEVKRVRVRRAGPEAFADVTLAVNRDATFEQTHDIATITEAAVRKILPAADVVVHVEPMLSQDKALLTTIRKLVNEIDGVRDIHNIRILSLRDGLHVTFHAQVDPLLNLRDAHDISGRLECAIQERISEVKHVFVHLERYHENIAEAELVNDLDMLQRIRRVVTAHKEIKGLKQSRIYVTEGRLHIFLDCLLDSDQSVEMAHEVLSHIEEELKASFTNSIVEIHSEPV